MLIMLFDFFVSISSSVLAFLTECEFARISEFEKNDRNFGKPTVLLLVRLGLYRWLFKKKKVIGIDLTKRKTLKLFETLTLSLKHQKIVRKLNEIRILQEKPCIPLKTNINKIDDFEHYQSCNKKKLQYFNIIEALLLLKTRKRKNFNYFEEFIIDEKVCTSLCFNNYHDLIPFTEPNVFVNKDLTERFLHFNEDDEDSYFENLSQDQSASLPRSIEHLATQTKLRFEQHLLHLHKTTSTIQPQSPLNKTAYLFSALPPSNIHVVRPDTSKMNFQNEDYSAYFSPEKHNTYDHTPILGDMSKPSDLDSWAYPISRSESIRETSIIESLEEAYKKCELYQNQSRLCTQQGGNRRLAVSIYGNGPEAVIMIHGICMSSKFWIDGLLKHISNDTLSNFTFYCPDLVGYGQSIDILPHDNYSRREQSIAVLRDVILFYKLNHYHLIGHSYGALVVLDIASRSPAIVKTITLLAPAYFETPECATESLTAVPTPVREIVKYPEVGRLLIRLLNFLKPYFAPLASKIIPRSEIPELSVWDFFGISPEATLGTIRSIVYERIDYALEILLNRNVHISVLHGEDDGVVNYIQGLKLANRYPNILLHTLPGLVHHFPTSHSRLAAQLVESHLTRFLSTSTRRMVYSYY